jgi:hypothetical protein
MLKKHFKKISLILVLFIILSANFYFVFSAQASAGGELKNQLDTAAKPSWTSEPTGATSLSGIVAAVIKALLGLLGIIFLVLIIYAGFEWMTAQGDEEKVTKAKDTLTRAIIGLVIIIAAYSITYFVFTNLPGDSGNGGINGTVGGGS